MPETELKILKDCFGGLFDDKNSQTDFGECCPGGKAVVCFRIGGALLRAAACFAWCGECGSGGSAH
jgi:hypothetical protein